MDGYTTHKVTEIISDSKFWQDWAKPFGWKLIGFSLRSSAIFEVAPNVTLNVGMTLRDSLHNAIVAPKRKGR